MTHGSPTPGRTDEPDEIDRLFAAYFHQQLPKSWPVFVPVPSADLPQSVVGSGRSRATLAVSVAALLGFGLYMSSSPRQVSTISESQPSGPGLLKNASARGPDLMNRNNNNPEAVKQLHAP